MKLTKFAHLLVIGSVLSFAAVGCKKSPTPLTPLPGAQYGTPGGPGQGEALGPGSGTESEEGVTSGIAANPPGSHEGWTENTEALQADTVYFDFDSAVVKSSEQPKILAVANYLKDHPDAAVRVEGNCDERGTEEYNRALGERRALAIRTDLVGLGIAPGRVDTVSYGEDRPVDPGHTPAAWAKNRRGDFVVLTPP